MKKPDGCQGCPFLKGGTGFVKDFCPVRPKIAMILKMPGREELVNGSPMTGRAGRYWEKELLAPVGIHREDLLIGNVIRCFPNGGEFPTGKTRTGALSFCRKWDTELKEFDPTVQIVTLNPAALLRTPQQTKFLTRSLEKAKKLADAGERPLVLMGEEAREVYASHLKGAMKKWQGHVERIKEREK